VTISPTKMIFGHYQDHKLADNTSKLAITPQKAQLSANSGAGGNIVTPLSKSSLPPSSTKKVAINNGFTGDGIASHQKKVKRTLEWGKSLFKEDDTTSFDNFNHIALSTNTDTPKKKVLFSNYVSPDMKNKSRSQYGNHNNNMVTLTSYKQSIAREHDFSPMPDTPQDMGRQNDALLANINPKTASITSENGAMPIIYGNGVSIESPDILSKFNSTGGMKGVQSATVSPAIAPHNHSEFDGGRGTPQHTCNASHDFSPMPATPKTPAMEAILLGKSGKVSKEGAMPIIYGNGVCIESPDILSKFSSTGGRVIMTTTAVTPSSQHVSVSINGYNQSGENNHGFSPMPNTPQQQQAMFKSSTEGQGQGAMPIIYGNGVSIDSPDILSKFSATGGRAEFVNVSPTTPHSKYDQGRGASPTNAFRITTVADHHDFSPMPATPQTPLASSFNTSNDNEGIMSYGNEGMTIESPDVLSKFNTTGGLNNALKGISSRKLDEDECSSRPEGSEYNRSGKSTYRGVISPLIRSQGHVIYDDSKGREESHPNFTADSSTHMKGVFSMGQEDYNTSGVFNLSKEMVTVKKEEIVAKEVVSVAKEVLESNFHPMPPPPRALTNKSASNADASMKRSFPRRQFRNSAELSVNMSDDKENIHVNISPPAPPFMSKINPPDAVVASPLRRSFGDVIDINTMKSKAMQVQEVSPSPPKVPGSYFRRGRILKKSLSSPQFSDVITPDKPISPPIVEHVTDLGDTIELHNFKVLSPEPNDTSAAYHEPEEGEDGKDLHQEVEEDEEESDLASVFIKVFSGNDDSEMQQESKEESKVGLGSAKVTKLGSRGKKLKDGARRKQGFFNPDKLVLEVIREEDEMALSFPRWFKKDFKIKSSNLPMESVRIRPSTPAHEDEQNDDDQHDSSIVRDADATLNRLRRRPSCKSPPANILSLNMQEDMYGAWMVKQRPSEVLISKAATMNDAAQKFFSAITDHNENVVTCILGKYLNESIDSDQEEENEELYSVKTLIDALGNTPVIAAVCSGNRKVLKMICKSGLFDLDQQNQLGNTALHFAMEFELHAMTAYLLKRGCTDQIKNTMSCVPGIRVHDNEEDDLANNNRN
jgi:hypothetical protein